MGQTLTYGVYLPDEGERNCYSGLANNWQILDDAVGAIAGKANASHTHGNITNGGAIGSTSGLPVITGTDGVLTTGTFGTTAGTFCEGNDSRLSDARTPVAHTHTTSEITDLLSGDHTWTGSNTFSGSLYSSQLSHSVEVASPSTSGSSVLALTSSVTFTDASDTVTARLNLRATNDGSYTLYPHTNNSTSLGLASRQWSAIYSQTYYYNGTQWGLDQANEWTAYQAISGSYIGTEFSTNSRTCLYLTSNRDRLNQSGIYIAKYRSNSSQGATSANHQLLVDVLENGTRTAGGIYTLFTDFTDNVPATANLKSLLSNFDIQPTLINGVKPSVLGFPGTDTSTNIDESANWNKSGSYNEWTAPLDGWIYIRITGGSSAYITLRQVSYNPINPTITFVGSDELNNVSAMFPVVANRYYRLYINTTAIEQCKLIPCLGNV